MTHATLTAEVLLNSFVLAIAASLVRVLFTKVNTFKDTIMTFIGGTIFGVIVGYLSNDISWMLNWAKIAVVIFALLGKEIFTWLAGAATDPIKIFKKIKGEGTTTNIYNTNPKDNDTH